MHAGVRAVTAAAVAATAAAEAVAGCGATLAAATFAAGVVLGLPHGAADHVLPAWSAGRRADRRALVGVGAAYAAAGAAALAALVLAPAAALVAALATSAWHFGTDDAAAAGCTGRGGRLAVGAGYGLAPVLGPLAWWPARAAHLLGWLVPGAAWPATAAAGAGGAVVAAAVVAVAAAGRSRRAGVAAELAVVVGTGVLVPPLAAFGCWFGLWHAPRHVARVIAWDPAGGRPARRLADLVHVAWPTTLAASSALVLAWSWLPGPDRAPAALLGLLAVSVPHAAIVARARQRRAAPPDAGPATVRRVELLGRS